MFSLTQQIAVEWSRYGIRCNAVSPGLTGSAMTGQAPDPEMSKAGPLVPLLRVATVEDVSNVIRSCCQMKRRM